MYCIMINFEGLEDWHFSLYNNKVLKCESIDENHIYFYSDDILIYYKFRFIMFDTLEKAENYLYLV